MSTRERVMEPERECWGAQQERGAMLTRDFEADLLEKVTLEGQPSGGWGTAMWPSRRRGQLG